LRCVASGPGGKKALILVQPDTVVRWHRAGFKSSRFQTVPEVDFSFQGPRGQKVAQGLLHDFAMLFSEIN